MIVKENPGRKKKDVLRDLALFVQIKNVKNTYGGVLLLVNLLALACNFTKSNTPPWVFFMFLKLYKWYRMAQCITYSKRVLDARLVTTVSTDSLIEAAECFQK